MPADVIPAGGTLTVPKPSSAPTNTIYAIPAATSGVAMNPPPLDKLPSIIAAIDKACAVIPSNQNVALVAVATSDGKTTEANLAAVARVGGSFRVSAWIGRSWGENKPASSTIGGSVVWSF